MKTIVVEKKDGKAIVVDDKGRFHKIKDNKNLIVGKEYEKGMVWRVNKKLVTMGLALAMVCTLGATGYAYTVPVDYVTLDINPSVELGVNTFGRVINVTPYNEDGTKISKDISLKGKSVKDALKGLIQQAKDQGYLKEDQHNAVMVTVTSKDSADGEDIKESAEDAVNKELEDENLKDTEVITENINTERKKEAEALGISPGKMLLIEKLKAFNSDIKVEDYANMPVKDIMKQVNEERKNARQENKDNKEASKEEKKQEKEQSKDQNNNGKASEVNKGSDETKATETNGKQNSNGANNGSKSEQPKDNKGQEIKSTKEENKGQDKKEEDKGSNGSENGSGQNGNQGKGNSNGNANGKGKK